jgi:glutathione synthase/RimK-type ligase-like ATP-grasp enzyme
MAKNLRAKIPATDTLIIRDVNESATKRFVEENQEAVRKSGAGEDTSKVVVAQNAREVAEQSVRLIARSLLLSPLKDRVRVVDTLALFIEETKKKVLY